MTDKQIIIDENKFEKAENEPINQEAVNKFIEDTNKFYIDGVDVSGCGELVKQDENILICEITGYLCEDRQNCYYKQLKRKEQECERLKHDNGYEVGALEKTIDNLKAENDELKNQVDYLRREFKKQKQINNAISRSCENLNCKDLQKLKAENDALFKAIEEVNKINKRLESENDELKEINSTLLEYRRHAATCQDCYEDGLEDGKTSNKELRKLKQTLTEIKEICKTNVCKHCYSKFKVDDNYCKSRKDCDCYNILQKINECEINNEC